jgi:hypothetical protein
VLTAGWTTQVQPQYDATGNLTHLDRSVSGSTGSGTLLTSEYRTSGRPKFRVQPRRPQLQQDRGLRLPRLEQEALTDSKLRQTVGILGEALNAVVVDQRLLKENLELRNALASLEREAEQQRLNRQRRAEMRGPISR